MLKMLAIAMVLQAPIGDQKTLMECPRLPDQARVHMLNPAGAVRAAKSSERTGRNDRAGSAASSSRGQ